MTTSQLIECIIGKKVCVSGESIKPVATAFQDRKIDEIGNELVKHGFNRYGYERMINGMTGEMMEGLVFIGPTYYQRLKHMVSDKYHSRARGPTQPLNRQPLEGRARQGGLRVGEMESNCLISHGVSAVVKERLMEVSDKYKTTVCDSCGFIVKTKDGSCPRCKTSRLITTIMPYSFKLLCQELQGFLIAPRIKFN